MIARVGVGLDVVEIGVAAGAHVVEIDRAAQTGDPDKVANALLSALGEGALYAVVHARMKQLAAGRGSATPRSGPDHGHSWGRAGRAHRGGHDAWRCGRGRARRGTAPGVGRAGGAPGASRGVGEAAAGDGTGAPGPGGPGRRPAVAARGTFADGVETPRPRPREVRRGVRAGGRPEAGIFRNVETGRYAVRIGTEHGVSAPSGRWETVLHRHPNPENVLTRRLPAPHDVQQAAIAAWRAESPITEFIEFQYPDGRRGRSAYTVDPEARTITIDWERPDGTRAGGSSAACRSTPTCTASERRTSTLEPGVPVDHE